MFLVPSSSNWNITSWNQSQTPIILTDIINKAQITDEQRWSLIKPYLKFGCKSAASCRKYNNLMIQLLRKKQQKYQRHRSLSRTETSEQKLVGGLSSHKTLNMFPNKLNNRNKSQTKRHLQTERSRRSQKVLDNFNIHPESERESRKGGKSLYNQNFIEEVIRRVELCKKKEKMKEEGNKLFRMGSTADNSGENWRTPTKLKIKTEADDQVLKHHRFIVQQAIETDKKKILRSHGQNKKAMALRQVLIGRTGQLQSEDVLQNLKKEYDARITDLVRREAQKREQDRLYYEKRQAEKEALRLKEEERRQRQKKEMEAIILKIKAEEQKKIDSIKKQIQKTKIQEEKKIDILKSELELIKKKDFERGEASKIQIQLQKKVQNLQKLVNQNKELIKSQQQKVINTSAKQIQLPKPQQNKFQTIQTRTPPLSSRQSEVENATKFFKPSKKQDKIQDLSDAQLIDLSTQNIIKKESKKQPKKEPKKEPRKEPVVNFQAALDKSISKRLPTRTESDEELMSLIQLKTESIRKEVQKPSPKPLQITKPKPVVQTALPPQTKPTPPPFQKPLTPPLPPKKDREDQEQDEIDTEQMKDRLNMVGQTIGQGSKDLKGISVNWMLPCFFLYRRFYQLRLAMLRQFQDFLKQKITTPKQIEEFKEENQKIRKSLQKMAAANLKKCTNPEVKAKLEQKFQVNLGNTLYQYVETYIQEVAKVQNTLPPNQNQSVKLHLLQILNSMLIIQQFQGKQTTQMSSEELFSANTAANVDKLIKQYHADVKRFQKMK